MVYIDRKDLTVIGAAVNVAVRIEILAPHNKFLVSEATLARADKHCFQLFDPLGDIEIRGNTGKVKLFVS